MGQNFAKNSLVPLSKCESGTYVQSLSLNIDEDPYGVKCHNRAQCGGSNMAILAESLNYPKLFLYRSFFNSLFLSCVEIVYEYKWQSA